MNYFRCTVGGSGGNWKLTVTCDSGFAGATISCTDGTTTLTATCPSSSPYTVIFKIPNGGTWIVSSGSVSTTVVISDTATLHQIPTGSTATPVNVIQTWLHCANIWNKTYTTINQVLVDTSTLLALISSNNAADYMARSTNWASSVCANQTAMGYIGNNNYCANKLLANSTWLNAICNSTYFESVLNVKVPTMTSNTTPYGVAISNGNDYYPIWKAFDGTNSSSSDSWVWAGYAANVAWAGYKFTTPVCINRIYVENRNEGAGVNRAPKKFKVQASNDGSSWSDISQEFTNASQDSAYGAYYSFSNNGYFLYYRVFITDVYDAGYVGIGKLQFYGRA